MRQLKKKLHHHRKQKIVCVPGALYWLGWEWQGCTKALRIISLIKLVTLSVTLLLGGGFQHLWRDGMPWSCWCHNMSGKSSLWKWRGLLFSLNISNCLCSILQRKLMHLGWGETKTIWKFTFLLAQQICICLLLKFTFSWEASFFTPIFLNACFCACNLRVIAWKLLAISRLYIHETRVWCCNPFGQCCTSGNN